MANQMIVSAHDETKLVIAILEEDEDTGARSCVQLVEVDVTKEPTHSLLYWGTGCEVNRIAFQGPDQPTGTYFGDICAGEGKDLTPNDYRRAALFTSFLAAQLMGWRENSEGYVSNGDDKGDIKPIDSLMDPANEGSDFETYHSLIY